MMTEQQEQLAAQKAARASGARRIRFGEREIEYKTDKEMRDAIVALEREVAEAAGTAQPRLITVRSTKGW